MYSIQVAFEDGAKHSAEVDGRDIRKWESETGNSFIGTPFSYTMLTDLARLALTRKKVVTLTTEEFNDQCVSVSEVSENEPLDPT